jgi:hypothetical protein
MPAYAITIFLSAFLLFQVQLLLGKYLLPWFGGAAAVWATCMLFFQVLLLAGYAYAHWLTSHFALRWQRRLHLLVLLASLGALIVLAASWGAPLLPDAGWKPPDSAAPMRRLLQLLAVAVGLPFFVLATTGALLQAWFSAAHPGASPYRLYALSNLGSLLGLLSYPFAVELFVPLDLQAWVWTSGYVLFALGIAWCAWQLRTPAAPAPAAATSSAPLTARAAAPTRGGQLLWFGLAACASALLLAVTNQLTQEVAAVPFLWMLPLALYLLSFILCFDSDRRYRPGLYRVALLVALALASVLLDHGAEAPLLAQIAVWSFVLFVCCMVCHGELARLKPAPRHLTTFYLMIALGGASGGVFVALIAPYSFGGFWELPIALTLCGALAFAVALRDRRSFLYQGSFAPTFTVLFAAVWVAVFVVGGHLAGPPVSDALPDLDGPPTNLLLTIGATYLVQRRVRAAARRANQPTRIALRIAATAAALGVFAVTQVFLMLEPTASKIASARSFYGILDVLEEDADDPGNHSLRLRHGRILHGIQFQSVDRRREPNSYYGAGSGVGLALSHHPARQKGRPLRVGIVGLGTGTLAAYGESGDYLRFYEINPDVLRLAAGPQPLFTYLRDTPARVDTVLGDARLALERELRTGDAQAFDVFVIDAFSSDAIPIHLLTEEAFGIYRAHLRDPHGVIAVHISNRFLDLAPVLAGVAARFGLAYALIDTDRSATEWGSTWVLLTRDAGWLATPAIAAAASTQPPRRAVRWTDDFSNLLSVLKL